MEAVTICCFLSHFALDKRDDADAGRQQAVPEPREESCKTSGATNRWDAFSPEICAHFIMCKSSFATRTHVSVKFNKMHRRAWNKCNKWEMWQGLIRYFHLKHKVATSLNSLPLFCLITDFARSHTSALSKCAVSFWDTGFNYVAHSYPYNVRKFVT